MCCSGAEVSRPWLDRGRSLVRLIILGVIGATLFTPLTAHAQNTPAFRAVWADAFYEGFKSTAEIDALVSRAAAGNYNAIMAEVMAYQDNVGNGHGAYWDSAIVPQAGDIVDDFDPLAYLVQQAHAAGIEVHCWLVPYRVCVAWPPSGNTIVSSHPEWIMTPSAGIGQGPTQIGGLYLLDPGAPAVQEYIISIVRELCTNYAIDGIHWDYIRYISTDAGYPSDMTYSDSGLARYLALTGQTSVPAPSNDAAWDDFRRGEVSELVRRTRAELAAVTSNPSQPLRHTAAVAGWGSAPANFEDTAAYRSVLQNWELWMRLGWLDGACPMIYLNDAVSGQYDLFRNWVDAAIGWRYDRHMYIGQSLTSNTFANNIIQMQYAYDQGADGTVNFAYARSVGSDWSWYPYLATYLYTQPVATPEMPWRGASATEGTLWGRITDATTGAPVDNATVTVYGLPPVQTDGNGYYVVTMIPADVAGTSYSVEAEHAGYLATSGVADVLAGDLVRLDLSYATPLTPILADVTPDPAEQWYAQEYFQQLVLTQGTAETWMLIDGPSGAEISERGLIYGWTPSESEAGQLIDFTVQAANSAGSDEVHWQVLVYAPPPCEPYLLSDFEGYASGTHVLFQAPTYSGSTKDDLLTQPSVSEVTAAVAPFSGSKCYQVAWQFVDTEPHRWMRLTTYNAPQIPNPTLRLDQAIRVRLRVDAGSFLLCAGVRETSSTAEVGADGGAAGSIEWIGATGDVDDAPQGVLVQARPGVWQTFIFNPQTDPIHGMTGDGELTSLTGKVVFEQLAFASVGEAGPFEVYLDDIAFLCDVPEPVSLVLESRDATGDVTPEPQYVESGAWINSTIKSAAPGTVGTGSRFVYYDLPNAGTDYATFVPAISVPGRYEAFATWANGANCYDAQYTIRHHLGSTIQLVDQIPSGAAEPANTDQWVSLGRYWFAAGQDADHGSVTVSEEAVSGKPSDTWSMRVYADGLKLQLVEPWPTGDYTGDGQVNQTDFTYWLDCMSGPGGGYVAGTCQAFDLDVDEDVDMADLAVFMRAVVSQ